MIPDRNITIHHLSRVEGHGSIRITIKDGRLGSASWDVVETPRFFEAMLIGKRWENAPWICGRICGICSIGHTLTSIRAIERAFGMRPTAQTNNLRLLLKHMETLQSHILHLYFLSAPDFLQAGSVFPLIKSSPEVVARAARLKKLANDICDAVGGRRMHPPRTVVGGFTMLPEKDALKRFRERLASSLHDLEETVELFRSFSIPEFTRMTEYVSLGSAEVYPFIGGALVSSDGVRREENDYLAMTNEYAVDHSTAKWCRLSRASYAVGALARLNNNFDRLCPDAQRIATVFGISPITANPFLNIAAQIVECFEVVHASLRLIDTLVDTPWEAERIPVTPGAGTGVAALEVPRGILYHAYEFNAAGRITACDCVIPTGQNHANIQHDLTALVGQCEAQGMDDAEISLMAQMLVRAYDPCISCSVH